MIKKFLHSILFIVLFSGTLSMYSQSSLFKNSQLGVNMHGGWNLPEYQFLSFYTNDYIRSIEVNLSKEAKGKNEWEQIYKYPSCGISFFYSTLGNNDLLGREIALTYFFKIDLIRKNRFSFYNRTGIGLGYVNEKFDFADNYLNVAVGSNMNIHFNQRWGIDYELSENFELNTGISFDHFSNANTSEPNLGINYVTAFAGVNYRLGERSEKTENELAPHTRENEVMLFASVGGKHARSLSSEYFLTSSLSFEIERSVWRAFHLGIGADVFYDSSQKTQLTEAGRDYQSHFDFQTGVHLSQTLIYNKFSISLQEGFYLGLIEQIEKKSMYNRGILRYQVSDKLWIRLAMKSHFVVLDYPEIGVGIKL